MAVWLPLQVAALALACARAGSGLDSGLTLCGGFLGYLVADLASGLFHFYVDNYGDASTPAVGKIIDAFQGHHARPWTITQRQPCNNLAGPCAAHIAPLVALLAASPPAPVAAFAAAFLLCTALAQQTHAWAHLKRGDVPRPVLALQDAGLLLSCRAHGAHHRAPFSGNYAIVSGIWNEWLDSVLPSVERVIYRRTGVAPRSWRAEEGTG